MKHIFIGDIHGKVEEVEKALSMEGKKIFVGDFIDSFDHSVEDHKKCYDLVFDAIDKGDARACLGNHELSYFTNHHRCSGWDGKRDFLMQHYRTMILDRFESHILVQPDFLVTHAGLTAQIWDMEQLTLETLPAWLEKSYKDVTSPVHYIGYCRGGSKPFGGIFWATFREDFEPIKGLTQVFGHTRQKWGIQIERAEDGTPNYCIDCLDWHKGIFLELDL